MRPSRYERLASAASSTMLMPAEPKAGALGILMGSSRRLLAARRSFRFMVRKLVRSVRRRRTAHRKAGCLCAQPIMARRHRADRAYGQGQSSTMCQQVMFETKEVAKRGGFKQCLARAGDRNWSDLDRPGDGEAKAGIYRRHAFEISPFTASRNP